MRKGLSRDRCSQDLIKTSKRKRLLCLLATIAIFIPTLLIYMSGSHSGGGFVQFARSYVGGSGLTNTETWRQTTQAAIFASNGACLRHPQKVKLSVADRLSGATGSVFSGDPVRSFPASKVKFASFQLPTRSKATGRTEPWCERWAVVTTIMEPSETVRRQVRLKDWCLVIVADLKSHKTYETGWIKGEGNKAVIYLSSEDQKAMKDSFVEAIHHLPCLLDAHTAPGSDPSANHSHRCSGSHCCRDDGRWSGLDTFPHLTDSNLHLRQARKWEATVTKCLCLICTSTANSPTLGQLTQ